jgi:hypothetical protein
MELDLKPHRHAVLNLFAFVLAPFGAFRTSNGLETTKSKTQNNVLMQFEIDLHSGTFVGAAPAHSWGHALACLSSRRT